MKINQNKVNGLLGLSAKAGKIAFGNDAVIETIVKNTAKLVIIAEDTSQNTAKKIEREALKNNIKCVYFGTIENNSKVIGKENKAIISIKDINFADAIFKIISGGDIT